MILRTSGKVQLAVGIRTLWLINNPISWARNRRVETAAGDYGSLHGAYGGRREAAGLKIPDPALVSGFLGRFAPPLGFPISELPYARQIFRSVGRSTAAQIWPRKARSSDIIWVFRRWRLPPCLPSAIFSRYTTCVVPLGAQLVGTVPFSEVTLPA